MKLVVQVRLLPTPLQVAALEATMYACNEAATWVSGVAFEQNVKKNFALRKLTYDEVKSRLGLGAQAAQHVIKKTCDAYTTLKANLKAGNYGRPGSKRYRKATEKPVALRAEGAQPYDDRMLSWQIGERHVSIWTVYGRVKNVAFTAAPDQLATLALYRRGESDLLYREGMWFLHATCEVPTAQLETDPVDFLSKARKAGVPVVYVDPAYTSRTCAECGHVDKANRVSHAWLACRSCGFVDHADRNSSRNIRTRACVLWRRGARSTAPAPLPEPRDGAGRKRRVTPGDTVVQAGEP